MKKSKLRQLNIGRADATIEAEYDTDFGRWRIMLDGLDLDEDIARMITSHPDADYVTERGRILKNVFVHINITII